MKTAWLVIGLLIFSLGLTPSYANPRPQTVKHKIQILQNKLNAIEKEIKSYRKDLSSQEKQLKKIDTSISKTTLEIENTSEQITKTKQQIKKLSKQIEVLEGKHNASLGQLQAYLKALQQHQKDHPLKLIIQQKKIVDVQKLGVWYEYFASAQGGFIKDLRTKKEQSISAKESLILEQTKLANLDKSLVLQLERLTQSKSKQQHTIDSYQKKLQDQVYQKKYIGKQHQLLTKLLNQLDEAIGLESIEGSKKFSAMAGLLPSPIPKRDIINRDTTRRYFQAKEGARVQAIHPGRVVFSEWLRGLGLLLIIDHGQGYMSLYGNNQVLFKSTGDWVNQGDKIAVVGKSGGQSKPGLYFEIRKDGSPLDTTSWIQSG